MPTKALLDSNVFIFGFERRRSNSYRILERLVAGEIRGLVTDRIVREVIGYFRRHYGKDVASAFRDLILLTCDLALEADLRIPRGVVRLVGRKDAGAVAAARAAGLARIVSTDGDFEHVPERGTPREFIQELGEKPSPGDE